jgi:uncharacterized membrane protein
LLGFRAWVGQRWLAAAAWLGVSAGTKQFVWVILPFLLIWQWRVADRPVQRVGRMLAAGTATAGLLNLPFLLDNPAAWVDGVLTPLAVGAPLVQLGNGIAALPSLGLPVAYWWHSLATVTVTLLALAGYWLYFEEVRWTAWVAPPVLLFMHSRSLTSYFTPWAVMALLCGAAIVGELQTGTVRAALAERRQEVVAGD